MNTRNPLALILAALLFAVIAVPYIGNLYAQDDPGEFVYRENDGSEYAVISVVTSEQMKTVIENQGKMIDRLDVILANVMTEDIGGLPVPQAALYINTADFNELVSISGIGTVTAGSLLAARGEPGIAGYSPFTSWSDLAARVNGIGSGTVSNLKAAGVLLDPPLDSGTAQP